MGILYNEKVLIIPRGCNIQYYKNKGYAFDKGDTIEVWAKDVPSTSRVKLKVQCDCCGKIYEIESKSALKSVAKHNGHIYCINCYNHNKELSQYRQNKQSQGVIDKYGVENIFQVPAIKEQIKETCLDKYEVTNPMQNLEIQEKAAQTNLKKYGYRVALNNPEIYAKAQQSLYEHGTQKCSTQQYSLFEVIQHLYPNAKECKLNKPVSRCSADIALILENCNIDIEYDGGYWHQDAKKDRARDEFFKTQGYKILRIKGGKTIPTSEEIVLAIDRLINQNYTYTEIVMPDYSVKS